MLAIGCRDQQEVSMYDRNDNNTPTRGKLLPPRVTACFLGISMKTLRRWRRHRLIGFVRLTSGQYRFEAAEVERGLDRRQAA